ncbi:MAG: hypothetical protein ISS35_03420 [Kiritimatiellae bacterium]|nr:hypothetical protein [Kiritimatiellia bacterium]
MMSDTSTALTMESTVGVDICSLQRPQHTEHWLTIHPENDSPSFDTFERIHDFIEKHNASILKQYVFGGCQFHDKGMKALKRICGPVNWPVTWIQGDACSGTRLTGIQLHAVTGVPVNQIYLNDRCVGTTFEDDDAAYCFLGNLQTSDITLSRTEQTKKTFQKMETALAKARMDFSHVIRTWLYLENLLAWYDPFNDVRTQFFEDQGVFDRLVPASTGIGTSNPDNGALVTGALAINPKTDKIRIQEVMSPLQCAASDYRSSFSRAVEVRTPDHSKLYISGTASIDSDGNTIYIDDCPRQIAHTMNVIEKILRSRDMNWENTTRAIAYFKNIQDASFLKQYCQLNGLPHMPIAIAHSDVCRDDLLFELELDAVRETP